jgi:membrane protease YdiL (CAAX protease family)
MVTKVGVNGKVFLVLLVASVAASLLVIPFVLALSPELPSVFTPAILVAAVVQSLIVFSVAIFVGLYLAKRVGFGVPILEGVLEGKNEVGYLRSILGLSIGMGVLATLLIVLFSLMFFDISVTLLRVEMSIPPWKAFLACFYGGIAEEVLCRLFLMTLMVWISTFFGRTRDGRPTVSGIQLAIILSSLVFGLGHLPITGDLVPLSPMVIGRALLLSGAAGGVFGWLYWKHGLESAMISHFTCDVALHVVVPLVASLFM